VCVKQVFFQDKDLIAKLTSQYHYFTSTTITQNDIRMVDLFQEYDIVREQDVVVQSSEAVNDKIDIVFVILAYHSPERVIKLIEFLQHPNHYILVHVDKAVYDTNFEALRTYAEGKSNLKIVSLMQCSHGGISLVYAEVASYLELLKLKFSWDYVINLSESDYTYKTIDMVRSLVINRINSSALFYYPQKDIYELRTANFYVECWDGVVRIENPGPLFRPYDSVIDLAIKGNQWHVLKYDFVQFMVNEKLARNVLFYLKNAAIPDETYAAVLANYLESNFERYNIKVRNMETHKTMWGVELLHVTCANLDSFLDKGDVHIFYRKFLSKEVLKCADDIRETLLLENNKL